MLIFETNLELRLKCLLLHLGYKQIEELSGVSTLIIMQHPGYGNKCIKEIDYYLNLLDKPLMVSPKANLRIIHDRKWIDVMRQYRFNYNLSFEKAYHRIKFAYPEEELPGLTWFKTNK